MTNTNGIGNFSNVVLKNWEKFHDFNFAVNECKKSLSKMAT
jgi:hypothetical protein